MPCLTFIVLLLLLPDRALAYLDPGSGSMMLQLLLGGLAGVAVLLRVCWGKLQSALDRLLPRKLRKHVP